MRDPATRAAARGTPAQGAAAIRTPALGVPVVRTPPLGTPAIPQRVSFHRAGLLRLCTLDFSSIRTDAEALAAISNAKRWIAEWPEKSLRVLTDVSDSRMSLPVIAALTDLAKHNERYVSRSAITGLALVHRVAFRQVVRVTGREIREFRTRAEAMEWLTAP